MIQRFGLGACHSRVNWNYNAAVLIQRLAHLCHSGTPARPGPRLNFALRRSSHACLLAYCTMHVGWPVAPPKSPPLPKRRGDAAQGMPQGARMLASQTTDGQRLPPALNPSAPALVRLLPRASETHAAASTADAADALLKDRSARRRSGTAA